MQILSGICIHAEEFYRNECFIDRIVYRACILGMVVCVCVQFNLITLECRISNTEGFMQALAPIISGW